MEASRKLRHCVGEQLVLLDDRLKDSMLMMSIMSYLGRSAPLAWIIASIAPLGHPYAGIYRRSRHCAMSLKVYTPYIFFKSQLSCIRNLISGG